MGESMGIRLGYIGNNKSLQNCSTDKTVSVAALDKLESVDKKIAKLKKVARSNILNTLKVLENNKSLGIKIYGLSPKLFPLPNYPEVEYFRYIDLLKPELLKLGEYIKANDLGEYYNRESFNDTIIECLANDETLIVDQNKPVQDSDIKQLRLAKILQDKNRLQRQLESLEEQEKDLLNL